MSSKKCPLLIFVWVSTLVPLVASFGIPKFLEFGECANVKVNPDLNLERYSGIWFNIETVPNEYTPITACSTSNYTWAAEQEVMFVTERGLDADGRKLKTSSMMHRTEGEMGVLTVDAEGVPEAPFKIVATDYDNYSCVYSCMAFMGFRAAFSWVYARTPTPDRSYVTLCRDLMAEAGIDPNAMQPVKQGEGCPYMEKLDSLLTYSTGLQAKAKAREVERTKARLVAQQNDEDTVTAMRETLAQEEERIHELEEKVEAGEREFLHTLAVEREREEAQVQELREELVHERRKHNRMVDEEEGSKSGSPALTTTTTTIITTTTLVAHLLSTMLM